MVYFGLLSSVVVAAVVAVGGVLWLDISMELGHYSIEDGLLQLDLNGRNISMRYTVKPVHLSLFKENK